MNPRANPPIAKQIPHRWDRVTGAVEDPYAWMLDRDDPDTVAYLEAENTYTTDWFSDHTTLLDDIFSEIKSRVQETDTAAPVRKTTGFTSAARPRARTTRFTRVAAPLNQPPPSWCWTRTWKPTAMSTSMLARSR